MKLIQLLLEYNRDATLKNWGNKLSQANEKDSHKLSPEEILSKIELSDPSINKQFVQWIVRQYVSGVLKIEDLYKVKNPLIIFQQYKKRLPQEKRDINKLSLFDLYDIESSISNASLQQPSESEDFGPDVKVLYNGPLGWLAIPQTEEASCRLGRGTKWCTAATKYENRFEDYMDYGDLYVWKDKNGEKFQFWYPTREFSNLSPQLANDKDVYITKEQFDKFIKHPILKKVIVQCEEHCMSNKINMALDYCKRYGRRVEHIESYLTTTDAEHDDMVLKYARDVIGGRWVEMEERMKKSNYASDYARMVLKKRWPEAEPYMLNKISRKTFNYASECMGGRWPELEQILLDESCSLRSLGAILEYTTINIKGRWPEGEQYLLKEEHMEYPEHMRYLVKYARDVIGGRWPEAERILIKNAKQALSYIKNVVKDRCSYLEPVIFQNINTAEEYLSDFRSNFIPNGNKLFEKCFIENLLIDGLRNQYKFDSLIKLYVGKIIHRRWPELEGILPEFEYLYVVYNNIIKSF